MVRAHEPLLDRERFAEERLGLGVVATACDGTCRGDRGFALLRVFRTQGRPSEQQRAAQQPFCFVVSVERSGRSGRARRTCAPAAPARAGAVRPLRRRGGAVGARRSCRQGRFGIARLEEFEQQGRDVLRLLHRDLRSVTRAPRRARLPQREPQSAHEEHTAPAAASTLARCRRTNFDVRYHRVSERARIGWPSRKRRRSSPSSPAEP